MNNRFVTLKPGREKSVLNRHPWIFSGAIAEEPEDLPPGSLVDVVDCRNDFLGRGAYNPQSQIRVRLFTLRDEEIDKAWFARKIAGAEQWRLPLLPPETDAYRLFHGEGDGIPGLIIDRYGEGLVVSLTTAGTEAQRETIAAAIVEALQPAWALERSIGGYRRDEGLDDRMAVLYGEPPADRVQIRENGLFFWVDIQNGQKTGFFLDQRTSRRQVREAAANRTVLNAFGYSGAFSVYALAGGARRAVTVDSSEEALRLAAQNHELNGQQVPAEDLVRADVFQYLREDETHFDLIVLDPPAFAKSKASINRAARAYKDINMIAFKRLAPGGLLWTFSCSGHLALSLHRKILYAAALDARRDVQIIHIIGHGHDHPINVYHPEGEYLTGFVCRVNE